MSIHWSIESYKILLHLSDSKIFKIPKSLRFQNDKYLTGTGQKRRLSARRLRLHERLDSKRISSRFQKSPTI